VGDRSAVGVGSPGGAGGSPGGAGGSPGGAGGSGGGAGGAPVAGLHDAARMRVTRQTFAPCTSPGSKTGRWSTSQVCTVRQASTSAG
jgi:hypothetical protein